MGRNTLPGFRGYRLRGGWAIVASCLAAWSALALDWPQFRGPSGDGTTEEPIATNWPAAGPPLLWRKPLTSGFSSLAVSQGRVLTLVKRTVAGQSQEVCLALNADSGEELWARPLGPALYDGGGGTGDGPRSTPTIRGDRVFVFSAYLVLACLDLNDGRVVWSHDLMAEYGAQNITWQSAASPLVEGEVVIVNANIPGRSLLALRSADGTLAWQAGDNDRMTHATPVAATFLDTRQVIFYTQSGLVSVDPATGAVLWRQSAGYNGTSVAASVVVGGNLVYASADYGTGARVVRIDKPGPAFSATQTVRKSGDLENHWVTPVQIGGYLFGCYGKYSDAGSDAPLECYRLDTLDLMWSQPGFGHAGGILAHGLLLMLTERGELVLIEPRSDAYREIARFPAVTGKCWNVPAVSEGRIYVRSVQEIAAFDVSLPPPAPLRLQAGFLADGRFELRAASLDGSPVDPARTNRIELWATPDPPSPFAEWTRLTEPWVWEQGRLQVVEPIGPEPRRFFRTVERP